MHYKGKTILSLSDACNILCIKDTILHRTWGKMIPCVLFYFLFYNHQRVYLHGSIP